MATRVIVWWHEVQLGNDAPGGEWQFSHEA
jgi:hypothetical protein